MKIGVITEKGNKYLQDLKKCTDVVIIKNAADLDKVQGIIIAGEESSEIEKYIKKNKLMEKINKKIDKGIPIFGINAGMIILAKEIIDSKEFRLGLMDIKVQKEGFINKDKTFKKILKVLALGEDPFIAVFVKAPYIKDISPNVGILCQIEEGKIVFARQGNFLACSFFTESDLRIYQYFLKMVKDSCEE